MSYVLYLLQHLADLPKTIYYNFRVFPFKTAILLPVLVGRKVKIKKPKKGTVIIRSKIKPFMIKMGVEGVEGVSSERSGFLLFGESGVRWEV